MPGGSTTTSSILKPLENALLALEDLAFGTTPGIRNLFPRGSGRHSVLGIPLGRIIYPVAFKTDPPCILIVRWHFCSQLRLLFRKYHSGFSCIDMNTSLRAGIITIHKGPGLEKICRAHSRATRRGSGILPSRVKSRQRRAASG